MEGKGEEMEKQQNVMLEKQDDRLEEMTRRYEEEKKRREELQKSLLEAREANRKKNEFLMRMSREIRTPMNSIIGLVYLTRENAENKKQVLENLDKIDLSAHFMLSFVDDILNLSQIESGNVALNLEDTDFLKFIDKLKTSVEELAEEKGVSLYTKMRGELDDEYCFDAEKLEKAMHNILFNAVKYTSAGGRVDFITRRRKRPLSVLKSVIPVPEWMRRL